MEQYLSIYSKHIHEHAYTHTALAIDWVPEERTARLNIEGAPSGVHNNQQKLTPAL